MSLKNTDVRTPGIAAIAKKFNLPIAKVVRLVNIGAKTEFEHNKNLAKAKQVARDHISERPDYYQKLKKMEKSPVSLKEMVPAVVQSWPSSKNIEDTRAETSKAWQSKIYHAGSVAGQTLSAIKNKFSPPEKPNMNPKAEPLPASYGGKALPAASGGSTGTGIQKDNEMSIKNQGTASNDYLTSTSISGGDSKSPTTPSNMSYTPTPGSGTSTQTTPREKPLKEPDEVVNAQGSVFDRMNRLKEENSVTAVRGLGFVSGDPAVDPLSQYINTNAMAYEDQNGNVLKLMKKNGKENSLGFTPYNPTQDHGDVKERILGRKVMKEARLNELSGGDMRDNEGGVSGFPKSAYRKNEIEEGKRLERIKKIGKKAVGGALIAGNIAALGQVAGDAAEGRGNPKRGIVAAASALPGPVGWAATGAHYTLKAKDFLKKRKLNEIRASTVGRATAKAAAERKELTSKKMGDKEIKQWWKRERLVRKGTDKLTGKSKVSPTLDEYVNMPGNEYTKPYFTKSLPRTTRTSHEHIRKPDTVEEPDGGPGSVSPNGKK